MGPLLTTATQPGDVPSKETLGERGGERRLCLFVCLFVQRAGGKASSKATDGRTDVDRRRERDRGTDGELKGNESLARELPFPVKN